MAYPLLFTVYREGFDSDRAGSFAKVGSIRARLSERYSGSDFAAGRQEARGTHRIMTPSRLPLKTGYRLKGQTEAVRGDVFEVTAPAAGGGASGRERRYDVVLTTDGLLD